MRKAIIFLWFFTSLSLSFAQGTSNKDYTRWSVGVRAGGSLMPDFENQIQNNFKLGFDAGVSATFKLNKTFSLKTELLFTQKGKSYSFETRDSLFNLLSGLLGTAIDPSLFNPIQGAVDDGVYSSYKGYHRLTYLEIPLLAEVNLYKFKITAGPYIGFVMRAYSKEQLDQRIPLLDLIKPTIDSLGFVAVIFNNLISSSFPGYGQTLTTESTETTAFTQFNYGYMCRLSYEIHKNTFLEARYTAALNSYLTDPAQNISLSSFTLGLSYNFGIKKMRGIIP